jgi:DtxR family Mn-dependent transcriptional regulator
MPGRRQHGGNSESVDNYLKAILSLGGADELRVTSTALADRLKVAPASITNMLQKLAGAEIPLVEYERHRGVKLSAAGKRRALEVLRHHRLIETFLYKILDYPIEELHDEAERLEHFISERFEERIAAKLGHPTIDPHGHFIPNMDGSMPEQASIRLAEVVAGGTFVVDSVDDRDATCLRLLEASGIKAGVTVRVKARTAVEGYSVSVAPSDEPLDLSREMAGDIRIVAV